MYSVIMPVWNRADFVEEAIQSVLNQSFVDLELIIVDDGSKDNVAEVVAPYLSDKVSLHRIPKSGASAARNYGLEKARYPYIAYLDSDNRWEPEFLETMSNVIRQNDSKYVAAYCRAERFVKDADSSEIRSDGFIGGPFDFKRLLGCDLIDLNTFVHSKNLLEYTGLFDVNLKRLIDLDLLLRIVSITEPIYVPEVLVKYYDGLATNTITETESSRDALTYLSNKYLNYTGRIGFSTETVEFYHDYVPYKWENLPSKKLQNFWSQMRQVKPNTEDYTSWGYPYMLQIEPTNTCNLKCPLCPVGRGTLGRKPEHMKIETFKSIIDEMEDYLMMLVLWDWGEPFMNPKLPEMIRYATERDIRTVTSTNAHFLRKEGYLEDILTSGLSTLIIAIDSLEEEHYLRYRKEGRLQEAIDGLKNVVKLKEKLNADTSIVLRVVAMQQNENEIGELRRFALEAGADRFVVKTLNPDCGSVNMETDLVPDNPLYHRFAYDPITKNRVPANKVCERSWKMSNIFSNGDVVVCCYDFDSAMKLGNINDNSFKEIWNSKAYSKLREKIYNDKKSLEKCSGCHVNYQYSETGWFAESTNLKANGKVGMKDLAKRHFGHTAPWRVLRAVKKTLVDLKSGDRFSQC